MPGDLTTPIALEPLTAGAVPSKVARLYESAFPARERLPVAEMLSWGAGFRLLNGREFCGLAFASTCNGIAWLLFFAIVEELRERGVGTRALAALEQHYAGHRLIIDVEAPNLAERRTSPSACGASPSGGETASGRRASASTGATSSMPSWSRAAHWPRPKFASSGSGKIAYNFLKINEL